MRIVFDASVLISAVLRPESNPDRALSVAIKRHRIIISIHTFEEISMKIRSPRFDRYTDLADRLVFLGKFQSIAEKVSVVHMINLCRDPKDNKYLELALSGKADCIITGDNDLLVLNPFENIPIITASDFLSKYS